MSRAAFRIGLLLAALAVGGAALCVARGLQFHDWGALFAVSAGLAALAAFYRLGRRNLRIAAMAEWTLLWIVFSIAGAVFTYAAAARGGPLHDAAMTAADARLGFDWTAWFGYVGAHPALHWTLALAYCSLMPQILLSVFWFAYRGWERRNAELLGTVVLALLLTTAVFHLWPALGPGVGVPYFREAYIDHLIGLRDGSLRAVDVMLVKGVIAFPSFHAVLAVLFAWAHRGSPSCRPVLLLNAAMLAAIPSEGGHYLIDVAAGVAIAAVAILAVRTVQSRSILAAPVQAVGAPQT